MARHLIQVGSKHWRRLEAEARVIALSMRDPESKRVMLSVAGGYKRLAERAQLLEAKQFIDGASFGPDVLKVMGDAFESAWAEIANNFSNDLVHVEAALLKLATALLSVASENSRNAHVLCRAALLRMAIIYRHL
jgi:hypothetical protein